MKITVSEEVKRNMEERKEKEMDKWEKDLEEKNMLEDSFYETCRMCGTDDDLYQAVKRSKEGQQVIGCDVPVTVDFPQRAMQRVIVSRKKTLEAARVYAGRHVAVLNFACATVPGGGGHKRGLTQEECLCRETTLHPCLTEEECVDRFYEPHKEQDALYDSCMIYTPGVVVFKTHDRIPQLMKEGERFQVDIITMAAPNLNVFKKDRDKKFSDELVSIFEERFTRIMSEAAKHDVEVLILGAFGCGEFDNDPVTVATGAARALEKFPGVFDFVEFAVYEPSTKKKFHTFRMVLDRYLNKSQAE